MSSAAAAPAENVVDLSRDADALYRNPYEVLARLRNRAPVHFVRLPGGSRLWLIVGHEAGHAALTEPTMSKDWLRVTGRVGPGAIGTSMISSDPPDHTRLRRLVSKQFTARRIAALAPLIRSVTDDLVERMARSAGPRDLIAEFAFPLPVTVISELLGVPTLDRTAFAELCAGIFEPSADADAARAHVEQINDYFDRLIAQKRENPGDDLLSALIAARDSEAGRLSHSELRATTFLLLVAGHATTTNLLANGTLALLDHPEQLTALRADWDLLPGAVEEILRYDGPQPLSTRRFTTEPWRPPGSDTVIAAGQTVMVALAATNRDAERFVRPDDFDIRRTGAAHLSFGHGIHYCLGAPLARLQVGIALSALLTRFPDLRRAPTELHYRSTLLTRALTRLPVLLW
ncbi:cytochrome P450 [Actinoplanes sp. NBRC 103695]|uniref:cytochrome P450 family protein n=1 Tax=Actinoplanes sp. NBRC 103695 TaxID=3032202 RepID=UPI0024A4AA61|nr:cytochrome P450 [Actinoplanes sp. NBRC 103695]GLZ01151.1 cytochrome P450 [Actinoplanes sp. NBRC 103695]